MNAEGLLRGAGPFLKHVQYKYKHLISILHTVYIQPQTLSIQITGLRGTSEVVIPLCGPEQQFLLLPSIFPESFFGYCLQASLLVPS